MSSLTPELSQMVRRDADSLLTCAVCMEPFNTPKILPDCQHTFCLPCLQNCYRASQQTRPMSLSNMPCPTCRKICFLPSGGVEELPTDFKIAQLKELMTKLYATDDERGRLDCSVCLYKGIRVTAVQNCSDCDKNLCDRCVQSHRDNVLFHGHTTSLIDYDRLRSEAEARRDPVSRCQEHKEPLRYFCEQCESAVCNVCVLASHDQHKVHNLEKAAEIQREILSKRRTRLLELITKVGSQRQVLSDIRTDQERVTLEASSSVREAAKNAHQIISQLEEEILTDLANRHAQCKEEISMFDGDLERCRSEAQGLVERLDESVLTNSNTMKKQFAQLAAEVRQTSNRLQQMEGISNDLRKCSFFIPTIVEPRNLSLGTLHHTDLKSAAKLKKDMEAGIKTLPKQRSLDTPTALREEIADALRLRERRLSQPLNDINALRAASPGPVPGSVPGGREVEREPAEEVVSQIDGFRRCRSVCFTPDGELAVCDNVETGDRIRIYGEGFKLASKLSSAILAKPWAISYDAYSSSLAVTDHGHSPIKIIKSNLSTNDISMLRCGLQKATGVAATKHGEYIITDTGSDAAFSAIYAQIPNGRVAKLYEFGGEGEGKLVCPNFVCVDAQDRILVSDCEGRDVKVFSRAGKFLFKFSLSNETGQDIVPQGICVDETNNILVADQTGCRVIKFSVDGEFINTVVEFTETPWGIAYDPSKKLLAISTDQSVLLHNL